MAPFKRLFPVFALMACLFLAGLVSPFASDLPDGLERAASDLGFMEKETAGLNVTAVAPDYAFPNASNKGLAGLFGALSALAVGAGAGYLMASKARK
ncbi:MAG: PDGLE domain-containing protein [Nitrospinae bacterium]|nr:PDGLE domain-containing protein [Nitrospinota bacterium]MBF0634112.1 PDGLE domain-containing protein [Nitrospinota bacterium]